MRGTRVAKAKRLTKNWTYWENLSSRSANWTWIIESTQSKERGLSPRLYGFWSGNRAKAERICTISHWETLSVSLVLPPGDNSFLPPTSSFSFSFQERASLWRSCCRHRRRRWPRCRKRSRWPWTVPGSRGQRHVSTTLSTEDNAAVTFSILKLLSNRWG